MIETAVTNSASGFEGTFVVTEGADVLGCSGGSLVGSEGPSQQIRGLIQELTCDGGSAVGTLRIYIEASGWHGDRDVTGPWVIDSGDGDFADFTGNGALAADLVGRGESGGATCTGELVAN
ncbi:MAG: hypothetical protein ACI8TP_002528 [Acidimicrobiales bacterium]